MRTVPMGDHSVSYERIGSGWYRFSVHHTATNRKILDGRCKVPPRAPSASESIAAGLTIGDLIKRHVDAEIKRFAEGELRALDERRTVNAEAYSRGKLDQIVGERHIPQLPPHRQQELKSAGRILIKASVPERIVRQAYDVSMKATGDRSAAACAALDAGHRVLIGVSDAQIVDVAERRAHLEGDSDRGITLVAGESAAAS